MELIRELWKLPNLLLRRWGFAARRGTDVTSDATGISEQSETPNAAEIDFRGMAAMWADIARSQVTRFEDAVENYVAAITDYEFRAAFHKRGNPPEWASEYAAANQYLTQHEIWSLGAERYFLLLALAQLRKCVIKLPLDGLPRLDEHKMIRLLRNIDEHWEQADSGRSLAELREWKPHLNAEPGQFWFNGEHVWFGDMPLSEISDWIQAVDDAVREKAKADGSPIPNPDVRL